MFVISFPFFPRQICNNILGESLVTDRPSFWQGDLGRSARSVTPPLPEARAICVTISRGIFNVLKFECFTILFPF